METALMYYLSNGKYDMQEKNTILLQNQHLMSETYQCSETISWVPYMRHVEELEVRNKSNRSYQYFTSQHIK